MKSLASTAAFFAICSAALAEIPPVNVQPSATLSPRAALKKLDLDGDGFISRDEAKQGPGLERRFGQIDSDKDGLLSQEELRVFLRERRDARREESPRSSDGGRRFAALDADKDGFLTRDEIVGRPVMQKRFQEIDSNNDNRLSRVELRSARRKQ